MALRMMSSPRSRSESSSARSENSYRPPTNQRRASRQSPPTKKRDTRSKGWNGGSVEVDAIPAPMIRTLVGDWIEEYVDQHALAGQRALHEHDPA